MSHPIPEAAPTGLPVLEVDCTYCATSEAQAAHAEAWRAWNADEQGAYSEFASAFDRSNGDDIAVTAWRATDAYRTLLNEQPEERPDGGGCVECEWTGKQLTDAGRTLLDFVRRYTHGPLDDLRRRIDGVADVCDQRDDRYDRATSRMRSRVSDLEYR